jgi:nucleoside-diphosphate-sugar epimerase
VSRALVTGAAGFLGRNLAAALAETGVEVDGIDLLPHEAVGSGRAFIGDVRTALAELPRYDTVFHFAASVGGRRAIEDHAMVVAGNLAVDLAFFDYVARAKPDHAVYASSSAVYGESGIRRCVESDVDPTAPLVAGPDGLYGWVKLTGERVAMATGRSVLCYRPFSVYGVDQDLSYPIPAIASRAAAGQDPLLVWGSGEQVRDFLHIDDAVGAMVASYRHVCGPLNLCTGIGTSFAAVAQLAAAAAGHDPVVIGDPAQPAGVAWRVGDPKQMRRWYAPGVSVADGIARVVAVVQRRSNRLTAEGDHAGSRAWRTSR